MAMTFGCAIIDTGLIEVLRRKRRFNAVLTACEMRAEPSSNAQFDPEVDLSEDTQLTVVTAFTGVEMWFGYSVAYMVERMLQSTPDMPTLTGLFMAQEGGSGTFVHQHIEAGRYGPGASYPLRVADAWYRSFPAAQGLPPRSARLDAAVLDLATELGAPEELVRRAFTGMSGGGLRGLTWHEAKGQWVLARALMERPDDFPTEAVELNPNSYAKRGKPFDVVSTKGALPGFLPQSSLFYEIQHRALATGLGARLDTAAGLSRLSGKPCTRFDIWPTPR